MSAEYPPIIIDGSNLLDNTPSGENLGFGAAPAADLPKTITIKPSLVSLYLIYDNQLIHQGDYKSEQIRLVWGSQPEQAMTVGGASMTLDASSLRQQGSGTTRVVQKGARKVSEIHLPNQSEPLRYGTDFHNFLVIVQRCG